MRQLRLTQRSISLERAAGILWAFSTTALRPQKSWRRYSWEFLGTNSSKKWKPDGTQLTACLNASRSNIKPLPQHFVSLVVMHFVFHLLMWACWKLSWPFWNPLRQRPKRFLRTSMSPFLRWYFWRNHYSVWMVRLQKRTHPWFPTLATRWDAASQISKALACWRCRCWIPGWRNWHQWLGSVRQAEQWVVQEMSGYVQTNNSKEDRQLSNTTEAAGLWDLFDTVVK